MTGYEALAMRAGLSLEAANQSRSTDNGTFPYGERDI